MANENINDFDYTINAMFNSDGTHKFKSNEETPSKSIEELSIQSKSVRPVKYDKKRKRKSKGIKEIAVKIIILAGISAGLISGIHELKNVMDVSQTAMEIKNTIGGVEQDSLRIGEYNYSEKRTNWWYDIEQMANGVLNENKEYDIDTRIFGVYNKMNEYNKNEHMDALFSRMSRIISENPNGYTKEEIASCLHSSFQEYLDSKGLNAEEYTDLMNKIIKAYAKDSIDEKELDDLLTNLNDPGSRSGGGR